MIIVVAILLLGAILIPVYLHSDEITQVIILSATFIVTVITILCGIGYYSEKIACERVAKKQGFECSFSFFEGCMVKYNGQWRAYDKLRFTDEQHKEP